MAIVPLIEERLIAVARGGLRFTASERRLLRISWLLGAGISTLLERSLPALRPLQPC